jgi:hypothetical protein
MMSDPGASTEGRPPEDVLHRARLAQEEIAARTRAASEEIFARVHAIHQAGRRGRTGPRARHAWRVTVGAAIIMVLLAMLGVGLILANSAVAGTYWIALVPLFGVLCVITAWTRARRDQSRLWLTARQGFHWLGIALAVGLDFFARAVREETDLATGLTALLLLAVGTFLAGVYVDWPLIVASLLLFATFVVIALFYEYVWLLLVLGALTLIAIAVAGWLVRHGR